MSEERSDPAMSNPLPETIEKPRYYRPVRWEYRDVNVANVWDYAPDIVIKKWIKGIFGD